MNAGHAQPSMELQIVAMGWEADGVMSVALATVDRAPLPEWQPGAHIDLCLPNGVVRQFSLYGEPDDRTHYRIAVLREPTSGGGSSFIHDTLRPGQRLTVKGPLNNFDFLPAQRYLFIAGGIGITPLLPMVRAAHRSGVSWNLLYGGRRRTSMAFLEELAGFGDHVTVAPEDEFGLLDLASWLSRPEPGTKVYCCGPEGLLAAVEKLCDAWPEDALQVERFAPKPSGQHDPGTEHSFDVQCQASGIRVRVPADKSILASVREAGIDVPSSCEEGICGTCETRILSGSVDHRDSILSNAERARNQTLMICVSRALSDVLVLDL